MNAVYACAYAFDNGFEKSFEAHKSLVAIDKREFAQHIFAKGICDAFPNSARVNNLEVAKKCAILLKSIERFITGSQRSACVDLVLREAIAQRSLGVFSFLTRQQDFCLTSPEIVTIRERIDFLNSAAKDVDLLRDVILDGLGGVCPELRAIRGSSDAENELFEKIGGLYERRASANSAIIFADKATYLLSVAASSGRVDVLQDVCEGPKAVPRRIMSFRAHAVFVCAVESKCVPAMRYIHRFFGLENALLVHEVVASGNVDIAKELFEGRDLTAQDARDADALALAALSDAAPMLRFLRESGLTSEDARRSGALCAAISCGKVNALRELRDGYGLTSKDVLATCRDALGLAAQRQHVEALRELREGFALTAKDMRDLTRAALEAAGHVADPHADTLRELCRGYDLSLPEAIVLTTRPLVSKT